MHKYAHLDQDQALFSYMTFYWRDGKMDQKIVSILFILLYEILMILNSN